MNLTYVELYPIMTSVFREFDLKLHETTREYVDMDTSVRCRRLLAPIIRIDATSEKTHGP